MSNQKIFERQVNGKFPILVDFFDRENKNCRTMQAILKIVACRLEQKIRIQRIDIYNRNDRAIVQQYLQIPSPTLMLFQNGQVRWKASDSFFSSRQLVAIIEKILEWDSLQGVS